MQKQRGPQWPGYAMQLTGDKEMAVAASVKEDPLKH